MKFSLKNPHDRLFFFYSGSFALAWIAYLSRAEVLLPQLRNVFQGLAFVFLILACLTLLTRFRSEIMGTLGTRWKIACIATFFVYMFVLGLPSFQLAPGQLLGLLIKDMTPSLFLVGGLAFGFFNQAKLKLFAYGFILFAVISLAVTTRSMDLAAVTMATDRTAAFRELSSFFIYASHMAMGSTFATLLAYYINVFRSKLILIILACGLVVYLYFSLFYSKRQGVFEVFLVTSFAVYCVFLDRNFRRYRFASIATMFVGLLSIGVYLSVTGEAVILAERVFERFSDIGYSGVKNFDRFEEARYFIDATPVHRILMGYGFSSFNLSLVAEANLHMGLVNLVFKGGVCYMLFFLSVIAYNVVVVIKNRSFPYRNMVLFFNGFYFLSLLYAPMWGFVPNLYWSGIAFFGPEIAVCLSRLRPEIKQANSALRQFPPPVPTIRHTNF